MALEIHKIKVRDGLKPRREPYWGPAVETGLTVGFRKIDDERGSWIARMPKEDPAKPKTRWQYSALGLVTEENDYQQARAAARQWMERLDAGVTDEDFTVADACREYVAELKREKGEKAARDAKLRFERTIYGREKESRACKVEANAIAGRRLDKLRTPHFKVWRDGLGLKKSAANRTLTSLKAALNLAVANRRVHIAAQREWADVKPYKAAGRRRDLFLDLKQRRALLAAAKGGVRDLLEAATLTGARAGEIVNATRSQFDARTGSMTFIGKTGRRDIPLSSDALVLFKRVAKDKLPGARLFVRDDSKPWGPSDWDELVKEAAKAAKLPVGTCLYTLRHSFVTQAITDGMTTLDVARLVGTSVVMIEKHYGHLVKDAARDRLAAVRML